MISAFHYFNIADRPGNFKWNGDIFVFRIRFSGILLLFLILLLFFKKAAGDVPQGLPLGKTVMLKG